MNLTCICQKADNYRWQTLGSLILYSVREGLEGEHNYVAQLELIDIRLDGEWALQQRNCRHAVGSRKHLDRLSISKGLCERLLVYDIR